SQGGFQSPMVGTQAVKFDDNGNPITATNSSIPGLPTTQKIFDIDVSNSGDIGAITQDTRGGATQFWQRSPLLGNAWFSTPFTVGEQQLFAPSADLFYDETSRPHVIGLNSNSIRNAVE